MSEKERSEQEQEEKAWQRVKQERPYLWTSITSFIFNRWQQFQDHSETIILVTILLGLLFLIEYVTPRQFVVDLGTSAMTQLAEIWRTYPFATVLSVLALILFLVGPGKLKQFYEGFLSLLRLFGTHWKIFVPVVLILIFFITYLASWANTWAITPAEVFWLSDEETGKQGESAKGEEPNGEIITIQFRANLNSVGTHQFSLLRAYRLCDPAIVATAKSTSKDLVLTEDCPGIVMEPFNLCRHQDKDIQMPFSQSDQFQADNGTGGQPISIGTVVGTFNFPLESLIRFIFRSVPHLSYREFSIQVIPATHSSETDEVIIVVTDLDGRQWVVAGPREDWLHLINFLAYRIAFDWKAEGNGQNLSYADRDLTIAQYLGDQDFTAGNYTSARIYYRIAEWVDAQRLTQRATTLVRLGMTHLELAKLTSDQEEANGLRDSARSYFARALALDPEIIKFSLRPQVACFDKDTDRVRAEILIREFNETLPLKKELRAARIAELNSKPPLGPGRHLSIFGRASDFDLYHISDQGIYYITIQSDEAANLDKKNLLEVDDPPRQIFAVAEGVYYLTYDGLVKFFRPASPSKSTVHVSVIGSDDLQLSSAELETVNLIPGQAEKLQTLNFGGIRQIFAGREGQRLFLIDHFGRILHMEMVVQNGAEAPAWTFRTVIDRIDARQIFLDGDVLYVLEDKGTVWRISDLDSNNIQITELLTDTDNREITAADGVNYLLRASGNIWRYDDSQGAGGELLKLIDPGVQTSQIRMTPQGLLVLKMGGAVWLIRNPQDPSADSFENLLTGAPRLAVDIFGPNLISLERDDSEAGPAINIYPLSEPISTPTPTNTSQSPTATACIYC